MMKKTRNVLLIVMLAIVLAMSLCLVGCGKEPTVKINSAKEVTLQLGETSTVDFTTADADTVTVVVKKGDTDVTESVYAADTKTFTAVEAGTFELTVTAAQKKKSASDKVTFTVTEANKSDLQAAITAAAGYLQIDYAAGAWTAFGKAKTAATTVANNAAATKDEVAKALKDLNEAVEGLTSNVKAVTRAVLDTDNHSFSFDGVTYNYDSHDPASIQAAIVKLVALQNNAEIKLQSQYNAEFEKIAGEMIARLAMTISGDGVMTTFGSGTKTVTVKVGCEEGATLTYKIKNGDTYGEPQAITGNKFDLSVTVDGGVYDVRIEGTKGVNKNTKDIKVGLKQISGSFVGAAADVSTFDAATGKIVNDSFLDWPSGNQKKFLFDAELPGDFEARATVLFKEGTDRNQAFAINIDQGDQVGKGEFAVRYLFDGSVKGLKAGGGSDPSSDCGDRLEAGKTNTFVLKRVGGTAYFYIEETAEDGTVTKVGEVSMETFTGLVRIGFNYENIKIEITDIQLKVDAGIANKTQLRAEYAKAAGLSASDYTAATWTPFVAARNAAKSVLDTRGKTAGEIETALTALKTADTGLVAAELVKATVNPAKDQVVYGDRTFVKSDYSAASWDAFVAAVEALPQSGLNSAYKAGFEEARKLLSELMKLTGNNFGDGTVYAAQAPLYNFVASGGNDDTVFTWYKDGQVISGVTGRTYDFRGVLGESHVIKVAATIDGAEISRESTVDLKAMSLNYADGWESKAFETLSDGSVKVVKSLSWEVRPNRLWIEDLEFGGNVVFEADVTYYGGMSEGVAVPALVAGRPVQTGDGWKMEKAGYAGFRYQTGEIVARGGDTDANSTEKVSAANIFNRGYGETIRVRFERTVDPVSGTAVVTAAIIVDGEAVVSVSSENSDPAMSTFLRLGLNAERASVKFSNITVMADEVINTQAMAEAIAEAKAVKVADYDSADAKVTAFNDAFNAVKSIYYSDGIRRMTASNAAENPVDQTVIDAAVAALNTATTEIKALPFRAAADSDKPTITDEKIVFGGQTYKKEYIANFDAVVTSLNLIDMTNMTVAEYRAAVKELLAAAEEAPYEVWLDELLAIDTNVVKTVGVYKQETFKFMYAKGSEDTAPVLTIDGQAVTMTVEAGAGALGGDAYVYPMTVEKGKSHVVTFDNGLSGAAHRTVTLTYGNSLTFEARSNITGWMELDDGSITQANGNPGWGGNWYEKQKAMSGTVITGDDIKVTFTTKFIQGSGAEVFGMFFGKAPSMNRNGDIQNGEYLEGVSPVFVIKWNDKKMAIEFDDGGQKPSKTGMSFDTSKPYTFCAERHIQRDAEGKITNVHYKFSILNPLSTADESLYVFERDSWMDGANVRDYTGPVTIKLQWEQLKSSVYDIKVETNGGIFNYGTYFETIKDAVYVNTDNYTDATAAPFKTALTNAIQAYYYKQLKTQAEVDAMEKALKDAKAALVEKVNERAVALDLGKAQTHNIYYADARKYNVTLSNLPADCAVKAYLDGEEVAVTDNKVSFTAGKGVVKTQLKVVVLDSTGAQKSVSYVNVCDLNLTEKGNDDIEVKDGVVYNQLYDIGWDVDQRVKAFAGPLFNSKDLTVTYKTRTFDAKNTGWNHLQFMMVTDSLHREMDQGRVGIKYNIGALIGDKQESADAVQMAKEVVYENRDLIKIGTERVLQAKLSQFTAGDAAKTKIVMSDITGDVTMDSVGQTVGDTTVGIGFQYENCAGAFYGIEIYEII